MIPSTLADWTEDSIRNLLRQGVQENERFDWKLAIPHKSSPDDKLGLIKDCAAFANSRGGFLVFGVDNDAAKADRVVGIKPTVDFGPQFGAFASACTPTVPWEARTPPIRLGSGSDVHVVEIRPATGGPHYVTVKVNSNPVGILFPKRTNKGNEDMSYDEIRMAFLGYHQRLAQMNLLRLELNAICDDCDVVVERVRSQSPDHAANEVCVDLLERVLADSYLLLSEDQALITELVEVRRKARTFNNVQRQACAVMWSSRDDDSTKNWLKSNAADTARALARDCERALASLKKFLQAKGIAIPEIPRRPRSHESGGTVPHTKQPRSG